MRYIIFFFLCLVWGTTWIAIKLSLEGFPPFLGAGFRFSLALILLGIFIAVRKIPLKMPRQDFKIVSISAFLMYGVDYGLIYWGEQYLSAGVTAIFFATFPLFTGIWATFLFKNEKFYWNKFTGLVLGFAGIAVVFSDQLLQTRFNHQIILGSAAIIIGAAGGAMTAVLVKKYLSGFNPVALSFHQLAQGTVFLFLIGFLLEGFHGFTLNSRVIGAVIYLGAIGSALAFALYYWLLQKWTATSLSLIIYITPLVALVVDYLVFGEVIQPRSVLGMFIIFSGIALMQLKWKQIFTLKIKPFK